MKWYINCIRKYANFKGRASVNEFGAWFISNVLIMLFIIIGGLSLFKEVLITWSILGAYLLFILIPTISVSVRRLHDILEPTTSDADVELQIIFVWVVMILYYGLLLLYILLKLFTSFSVSFPVLAFFVPIGFVFVFFCGFMEGYKGENHYGEPQKYETKAKKHKTKVNKCTICRQETFTAEMVLLIQQQELARNTVQSVMRAMEAEQHCGYRCKYCGKIYCKNCIGKYGTVMCPKCFGTLEYT